MSDTPKLSAGKSVGFRPSADLRKKLEELSAATGRTYSLILRDGVQGNWPQIKALNLALAGAGPGEDSERLLDWLAACREAQRLGLDPRQTLLAAATAKHEAA